MKALDAPSSLSYFQAADSNADSALKSRNHGSVNLDEVTEACIRFSAKGLDQASGRHIQPYLVLVQNDREIGRTEAVGGSDNVTWTPAQVAFSDAWMPVSVQVWVYAVDKLVHTRICTCTSAGRWVCAVS